MILWKRGEETLLSFSSFPEPLRPFRVRLKYCLLVHFAGAMLNARAERGGGGRGDDRRRKRREEDA